MRDTFSTGKYYLFDRPAGVKFLKDQIRCKLIVCICELASFSACDDYIQKWYRNPAEKALYFHRENVVKTESPSLDAYHVSLVITMLQWVQNIILQSVCNHFSPLPHPSRLLLQLVFFQVCTRKRNGDITYACL